MTIKLGSLRLLVHLSVVGGDGTKKELLPVCGLSSHEEGRHRSGGGGEGHQRKTPSRSSLHLVSKGQEEQWGGGEERGRRRRRPAEFTA